MSRPLSRLWLILFALFVAAPLRAAPGASSTTPATDYVLQPSDLLRVQVFQEPDMMREVRISQEYTISLPMIDKVSLRNKTVRQAEQLIRDLYDKDYLVNPQITVSVLEYARRTVNVLGQVNAPGPVQFPSEQELTLVEAITRAGSFNRLANKKNVQITRAGADGKTETFTVNVEKLMNGGSSDKWPLQVGDTIYVQERVL